MSAHSVSNRTALPVKRHRAAVTLLAGRVLHTPRTSGLAKYHRPVQKPVDFLARVVATAFGSGYSPVAPGTAGSAVGLLLFWPMAALPWAWLLGASAVLFVVGSLAAGRVARRVGLKDPGIVVVDEVVGQWVTLSALPFTPVTAALGFLLFRAMDIAKPWPARDLERVPGGWGIMADDVAAGVYAHLLLRVLLAVWPVG
jgi:phosphatidylglycerophosphatase A